MSGIKRSEEQFKRNSLGIPPDAEHILIFGESSHWDPNWLLTSEEYYEKYVERIIDRALEHLIEEPRRIYTIESVFFLRMYWDRRPEQRERIRGLIGAGRLRMANPAVSTADTLIPTSEAILRDFLTGQEWLRHNGLDQEPKLAYFPDSFGATPALPSLLQSAGFTQTAITRIDGMYFPGFELNLPWRYPKAGSSAERLLKNERSLDFVWRDGAGAEVLCHWNAFSYGQGDMLAYRGISRNNMLPISFFDPSEKNVARKIHKFSQQLLPVSRTPYLFCPIGIDFVLPIPNLISMLDRYNRERYPTTGIWVLNAGLDDYLDLVEFQRHDLPVIELDPNPYWSGFYTTRPGLKARCHDLVDRLLLAESLTYLPENAESAKEMNGRLDQAWWTAAVSNHHDFITGTSPDRTVQQEQVPWLESAQATADLTFLEMAGDIPGSRFSPNRSVCPAFTQHEEILRIESEYYILELDAAAGGAIVRAEEPGTGMELFQGLSNDLFSYRNTGGLWRMGHEFRGGTWRLQAKASDRPVEFRVEKRPQGLEVSWLSVLDGEHIKRSALFASDSPLIRFRVTGRAAKRRTLTVSFATDLQPDHLFMDVPGGVVSRPLETHLSPTFWSFQHFIHIKDRDRGLALFQRRPGAAAYGQNQALELVVLRNATRERAYRFFPVSGNPAKGYEQYRYTFEYALAFTSGMDWNDVTLAEIAYSMLRDEWRPILTRSAQEKTARTISLDRSDIWVMANKPASRGDGRVIRLQTFTAQGQPVSLKFDREIKAAFLCDARERDLSELEIADGNLRFSMPGSIASLRIVPR